MRNLIILAVLSFIALLCVYMDEASRANKKVLYVLSHDNGKKSLLFDDFSEALPPVFDEVFTMQDGLMRALKNGYSVIVTEKGKILPGEYQHINEFKEDLSSVKSKDKKWGFIDRSGKVV
ncbi:WG repeat-containing protein, partial [bacterium]|nr:WG repeat-containing protein [bacterium]